MIRFCKGMRGKVHAPGLSGGRKATSLRSQVVRVGHAPPLAEARSTWQGGCSGPRCIPPVQGLCPLKIPPPPARGGRAYGPLGRGRGALAGALCVSWETPAAWRGSGLTWAGQPPRTLDGARAEALPVWRPRLAPMASASSHTVCTAGTVRLGEEHT
jgi:hypothetical protein